MSKIKFEIIGGSFGTDYKIYSDEKNLYLYRDKKNDDDRIYVWGNIENIMQVTEENKHSMLAKAGWAFVGGVIGGVFGMAAGLLAKGNKKEICFACELQTGEKFLAKTDNETFQKLLAISMM